MPVYDIRSISQVGTYEPFELQVARGQIPGHSIVHVFGFNPDVDTSEETVWPIDGILGHPASPAIMSISSSSADDDSTGTGARTVLVEGVNGTGGLTSEVVILDGQTAVNTTKAYDAIERMTVLTVGSGGKNAGIIYAGTGTVTAGVPAVPYSAIGIGDNTSLVGHWTCPTGYTGYLVGGKFTVGPTSGNQYVIGRLKLRGADNITRTAAITTLQSGTSDYLFQYPVKINATECVTATAQGSGSNNTVSSYFQIVLIQERGPL
jgi:hypothetical protein